MKRKIASIAALWLCLLLAVFVYTDRDEYTWRFAGETLGDILMDAQEAKAREAAAQDALAAAREEAARRTLSGTVDGEVQFDHAPTTRPIRDGEPGLNLPWGTYEVTVAYSSSAPFEIGAVSAGRQAFIRDGRASIAAGEGEARFAFTLTDSAERVFVACGLPQGAQVHAVTVRKVGSGVFSADLAAYALLLGGVLTALVVLSWDRSARVAQRRTDALVLIGAALFASMPLLWSGVYDGHDLFFHLNRIEGIAAGLRAGQFPVRIHASTLMGYGYAAPQFYPELFLYFPAVMRNLGVSLSACVRVFEMMINLAAALVCYFSCRRLMRDRYTALGASVLYTLCLYRLCNMYVRATLGESLAMVFFPLLILGMAEVFAGDERRWPLLSLAMTGIFMAHLLSAMFAVLFGVLGALLCAKKLIREPRRIFAIVKAALTMALCSLWFLVPMLDYTSAGINTSVTVDASEHVMRFGAYLVGFPGDVMGLPYEATDFSYTVGTVPGYAILLGCALLVLQFYVGGMNAGGEDGRRDRLSLALLLLGALALLGATELFPWDWACSLSRPYSTLFTQIQYPWRLVGVACPLLCIAGAWGFMRSEKHRRAGLLAIAVLSCVFAGYTMQVFVQQEPVLKQDSFCDTRIRQYEYLYENTYKEALLPGAVVAVGAPEMTIENYDKQGTNLSFTISLPQGSQYLELPLLYYPGYKAEVNGEACRVVRGDNNVLRVYGVPEGAGHDVRVWFESPGIWLAAQGASLCGAALLALALLGMRRRKERA
ncbi:MAG: hypothetical protein IJO02_07660 [Clostridia bacterium]|nr:hypothetical protein [Clostridia bacterium]